MLGRRVVHSETLGWLPDGRLSQTIAIPQRDTDDTRLALILAALPLLRHPRIAGGEYGASSALSVTCGCGLWSTTMMLVPRAGNGRRDLYDDRDQSSKPVLCVPHSGGE